MASKFIRRFCSKATKSRTENREEALKQLEKSESQSKDGTKPLPSEVEPVKRINVSLQGANTKAGYAAALLLKQHPLIKKIYLYDNKLNCGVAADLNAVDSSPKVEAFCGDAIAYSMRAADIAVLIDTDGKEPNVQKKFELSYFRVKKFAETCNLHCPKAIHIVCVDPICCMTSLVQSVLENTPFYHPSRLLGSVTSLQAQINAVVGKNLNLDPSSVHVPLLGGPDAQSVVPLISLMTPDPGLSPRDQISFYELVKKNITSAAVEMAYSKSMIHEGYAIGKIVITVAKGLNGHSDALASVLARTTQAYPLKYLVSTVRFGVGGIYHNYGIPKLTPFEVRELEKSIQILEQREIHMEEAHKNINKAFVKTSCY